MDEEEQGNSFNKELKPVSIDKNGEPVYSLEDFLQHRIDELNADIDEACAVFGECNDVECSYNKGYLKRQALYACHTCIPESKLDALKAAGVCLACSLHCHNGHDLVELYTKRNFRCDCGNSKFESRCTLIPEKAALNTANSYNQNFTGLYCTCARPYPDPDDDVEDDMISCALCEDWFHTRHLGIACPPSNSYEEMICEACIKKHDFLLYYDGLSMTRVDNTESAIDVNVIDENDSVTNADKTKTEDVGAVWEQEVSDELKVADNLGITKSIPLPNNDENEAEKVKGSEQGLEDELPEESLDENVPQPVEEADDVYEISSEDVEMNLADSSRSNAQQESNNDCDNLNDISRQCEEINKAIDDSNKQEAALASASEDLTEQVATELDAIDTTQEDENITKQEESQEQNISPIEISDDQVDVTEDTAATDTQINQTQEDSSTDLELDEVSKTDHKEVAEENLPILENTELLNEKKAESTSKNQDPCSTGLNEKETKDTKDNNIQEGEVKRVCKKPKIKSDQISTKFYESSRWRENLCICAACTKLYTDNNVTYLLDPQDTLQFYKEFGREVYVEGAYGAFKRKLDSLPHTGKIFLAEGMAEFKDKFGEFLKQFADEQRVITCEDVRIFFGNLDQSRKRRKMEMESNYYCR